ncbi:tetratricopeptide repeat-containing sensor histidine kinase [Catalinimonas niigatensis]|uniref:tetratricopeptide repeat-containing sensor histidine kinase n=1 Tax=Catalinimonas niigatensis TaxID=1397264 RepID=UPI0026670686|nr:tetratricopeptide repeat protein [Catalinimonas niigatensis]WPP52329.1 tetratricopeptide repeat protein [Catalinimonas niigatensis]
MMKSLSLFFFFLLTSNIILAQQLEKIDSLVSELKLSSDKEKIDLLNQIGWEYRLSYPDSTLFYCQKAIDLSLELGLRHGIAQAHNYMGVASVYQGKYSEAFIYHKQAQNEANAVKDFAQVAHAYNSLGRLFFSQGDQIESHGFYHKALEIFEKINDRQGAGYCYKSLAQLYTLRNEFAKAQEMLQKALSIRQELKDSRGMISVYEELAMIAKEQFDYPQAHDYLQKAKDLSTASGDQISVAEIDLSMSSLYLEQDDYQKALITSLAALTIAQSLDNQQLLTDINLLLGQIYLHKGNLYTARQHLEKVIEYADQSKLLSPLTDAHYYLAQVHEQLQAYQKALFYHKKYITYKDSLFNVEKAKNMERLETRLLLSQKEYEYNLLEASAAQQEFILEQERSKNVAQSIVIVLTLVLLSVVVIFYNRSKTQNRLLEIRKAKIEKQHHEISLQNDKISEQYLQMELQNKKLKLLNQEKDTLMNMVAHDLKSPLNRLSGLSDLLLLPDQNHHEREKYASLIKETSQEGVNLVKDLLDINAFTNTSGINYADLNLKYFLEEQAKAHLSDAEAKEINLHVQCDASIIFRSDAIYLSRVLDNLISNAIKYSYTKTNIYIIGGTIGKEQVMIGVKDQGPGFSHEDKKHLYKKFKKLSARPTSGESSHGLGLAIIKTLVDKMNGSIHLESEVGQGSEFILRFPIKEAVSIS